jgi:16S rRNA (cytosine1402-N4)-methyltransferase
VTEHTDASNHEPERPYAHRPVMVAEIVEALSTVPPGVVLDATLGGGGHSEAILDARDDVRVLGLDRDRDAIVAAVGRLERFGDRVMTHRCRFDDLDAAMRAHSVDRLSGAVFDLGVSSPQLDRAERGFSYRHDGPLDMRMDSDAAWSADDVVNGYPEVDLARLIRRHGDERFASRIARAIVAARPIESTTRLAEVVTTAIPAPARRTGGHPAKRTFQAIRIEVNGELDALPAALDAAIGALDEGGRLAVLSYHSGEDRIAKQRIRAAETGGCECPPELPCVCGAVQTVRIVRRIPKQPGADEQRENRRASAARLRVAEKIAPTPSPRSQI